MKPIRTASSRTGWSLAAINVLLFAAIVASKQPEYDRLRADDQKRWSGGLIEFTSADPMYVAGRPFYSSAHHGNVPLVEDLFLMANTPALLAAFEVSFPIANVTSEWWTGSARTSTAWESWTLASAIGGFGILWAFVVGVMIDWWRDNRH